MLAGTELTLLGFLPLIRIVEHAEDAESPVDLVLEMILGQVECDRREPVQVLAQPVQRPDVRLVGRAERGRILGPHIRPEKGQGLLGAAGGMVRHRQRPDREGFLQVGRRLHADRRR